MPIPSRRMPARLAVETIWPRSSPLVSVIATVA
jgi:hypothetical protein